MKPEFHPAAEREFLASAAWYESRVSGLGGRLRDEVRRAIGALCARPNIGGPLDLSLRHVALRRFPYRLIYQVMGDKLRIIAVAHTRRRPGYWSRRR